MASSNDTFFKLTGKLTNIRVQSQFYAIMKDENFLCGAIYKPNVLERGWDTIGRDEGRDNSTSVLEEKTFHRVSFAKTTIRDIVFRNCIFENCYFMWSRIERCEFHGCTFKNTNMSKVSFEHTYIDPMSFEEAQDQRKHQNIGVHLYQALTKNSRDFDQPKFEADSYFYFKKWKRYQNLYEALHLWSREKRRDKTLTLRERLRITAEYFLKYLIGLLWEVLAGSGVRFRYFLISTALGFVALAWFNYSCSLELGLSTNGKEIVTFVDSAYFTAITLTTIGYGEITPSTQFGKVVVALEGVGGFFVFALLASMMYRKVAA